MFNLYKPVSGCVNLLDLLELVGPLNKNLFYIISLNYIGQYSTAKYKTDPMLSPLRYHDDPFF